MSKPNKIIDNKNNNLNNNNGNINSIHEKDYVEQDKKLSIKPKQSEIKKEQNEEFLKRVKQSEMKEEQNEKFLKREKQSEMKEQKKEMTTKGQMYNDNNSSIKNDVNVNPKDSNDSTNNKIADDNLHENHNEMDSYYNYLNDQNVLNFLNSLEDSEASKDSMNNINVGDKDNNGCKNENSGNFDNNNDKKNNKNYNDIINSNSNTDTEKEKENNEEIKNINEDNIHFSVKTKNISDFATEKENFHSNQGNVKKKRDINNSKTNDDLADHQKVMSDDNTTIANSENNANINSDNSNNINKSPIIELELIKAITSKSTSYTPPTKEQLLFEKVKDSLKESPISNLLTNKGSDTHTTPSSSYNSQNFSFNSMNSFTNFPNLLNNNNNQLNGFNERECNEYYVKMNDTLATIAETLHHDIPQAQVVTNTRLEKIQGQLDQLIELEKIKMKKQDQIILLLEKLVQSKLA